MPALSFRTVGVSVAAAILPAVDAAIGLSATPVVDGVRAVAAAVQPVVDPVTGAIVAVVGAISGAIQTVVRTITDSIKPLSGAIVARRISAIRTAIQAVVDPIAAIIQAIVDAITAVIQAVVDAVAAVVQAVFDPVAPLVKAVLDSVAGVGECEVGKAESEYHQQYSLLEVHFLAPSGIGVVSTYNASGSPPLTSYRTKTRILSNTAVPGPAAAGAMRRCGPSVSAILVDDQFAPATPETSAEPRHVSPRRVYAIRQADARIPPVLTEKNVCRPQAGWG